MNLEELIHKHFSEFEPITKLMTIHNGKPAIFYQFAPDDQDDGWGNAVQYPRIVYGIDMQANQERKSAGTMEISLLCDKEGMEPEMVEPLIRERLKDLIIKPDGGNPYCFAWSRTDAFEIPERESGANTGVIGDEIRFDILEYPNQETTDPDPVVALNRYIKETIPEAFVLGLDHMNHFRIADAKAPVFYCRLKMVEKGQETNTVAWMDGKIAVHLLCPDSAIRIKIIMALANSLSLAGEVIMLDKSPMFIKRLQVNNRADYLKEGQLFITIHYGLLRYKAKQHELRNPIFNF